MKILAAVGAMIFLVAGCATGQTNSSPSAVPFLGDIPQFHLTTNKLSDAEIQGCKLAQKILEQQPTENSEQTGVLKIRDANGKNSEISIKCKIVAGPASWTNIFQIEETARPFELKIVRADSNQYFVTFFCPACENPAPATSRLDANNLTWSIGNSDFWACDLGLEFFHWPEQMILKKEIKRSRGCSVLESTNPDPSTNGYSRVVSWIDNDGGGIVQAFAYDVQGKLLKEFYPTSLKKVNGQYQVQEMEMLNDQTKSRTRLTFDLKN
jgi:hypothetical protein